MALYTGPLYHLKGQSENVENHNKLLDNPADLRRDRPSTIPRLRSGFVQTGSENSRGPKTAFGVVVPDLPGCFSAGDTAEEAFDNARVAIAAHCEILAEDGRQIPIPKSVGVWQADKEFKGWMWGIADGPVELYFGPAERINITIPKRILKRIDSYAKEKGESGSGFLLRAAEDSMRKVG